MKAIIPVAGLGTRMLPITKTVPKELIPVKGKPAIQWVLEEAINAGFREFIVVLNSFKSIIRHYLTPLKNDHPLAGHPGLADLERSLRVVDITFVEQREPRGLGDAVLRCRDLIGKEPFALLLPDNICPIESRLFERLLNVHQAHGKSCIALRRASGLALHDGAIIAQPWRESVYNVQRIFPKGSPDSPTTDLRGIGRYILESAAFIYLEKAQTGGELDDIPALDGLARDGRLLGLLVTDRVYHLGMSLDQTGG